MNEIPHILADGIPPGVIFAIAVTIIIAVANVMAKKKQSESMRDQFKTARTNRQRPSPQTRGAGDVARPPQAAQQTLSEIIREQIRRAQAPIPPAEPPKRRNKPRRQAPPPPLPAQVTTQEPLPDSVPTITRLAPVNGSARKVRLMLQPGGIREAFILSEVLGKPKALRED